MDSDVAEDLIRRTTSPVTGAERTVGEIRLGSAFGEDAGSGSED